MLNFQKLLFPVDFSDRCLQTAPCVAALARKFESEVILLNAFSVPYTFGYGEAPLAFEAVNYGNLIREGRVAELDTFGKDEFAGLTVTREVEVGEPADRIVACAQERGVGLIVMPTHGQGRFRQLLLGSVTSKVLHDASCPVWTTAHSEAATPSTCKEIKSIVCAVDLGPDSLRILRAASEVADRYGAVIRLLHAIPAPDIGLGYIEDAPFQRFLVDTANQKMDALQQEANTRFEASILRESVASAVREVAAKYGAGLTVIGRGRSTEFLGRFRTNLSAIIRESPCPVLSI